MEVFIEIKIAIKYLVILSGKIEHLDDKCHVFGTFFIPCVN
jgi:hypothetical protein